MVSSQIGVRCKGNQKISISFQLCPLGSSNTISENQQNQQISTPSGPGQPPRYPDICSSDLEPAPEIQATVCSTKSVSAFSFHHQAAAPNQHQLPVSTTRQQYQTSISFQLPPPDSSTKSASASSSHHQAAAPHQPAFSKASSQPAVNSTSLPHPHHGSQVCCCLDIL